MWILSEEQLANNSSRLDGITRDVETLYRFRTLWFIEELVKELRGTRIVASTAAVYFHRFYSFQSFKQHNRFILALTCTFLSSKVEEKPVRLKDLVSAFSKVKVKSNSASQMTAEVNFDIN